MVDIGLQRHYSVELTLDWSEESCIPPPPPPHPLHPPRVRPHRFLVEDIQKIYFIPI